MLGLIFAVGVAWGAPTEWRRTLDGVVPGVVVIKTYGTRVFDTERSGPSVATGFIVDKERGIIVSNRHVVQPGPTVAEAHLQDNEEIPLQALYRDPVHDFGFFRFDPDSVRFMEVVELPLVPSHAEVGSEIRLVGNDAGEKISILDGTLARLDRPAPIYGRGRYNDFNTFYYQAASGSSGGSSGSPVVDVHGHVIALNAGSKRRGASSYFLPLDRVVRALKKIQAGEPVTRGGLQVTFKHGTFDEVQRLGLSDATQARVRQAHPDASGLLTVRDVLPGGPADGKLQPGDVVVGLDGVSLTGFVALETILDDRVGQTVVMDIEREGAPIRLEMEVADLHQISPSAFLEVGGSIVHPLSYQMARHYEIPVRGLMLAKQGYMFRRAGVMERAVLLSVNDQPVPTLDALQAALEGVPDLAEVPVQYFLPQESRRLQKSSITMDRRWFRMRRCALEEGTGRWPCVDMPTAPPTPPRVPQTASAIQVDERAGKALAKSLVQVQFSIPVNSDGVIGMSFRGAGLIVDAEAGLVITDRDTVPVLLGDVRLTFGGSVEIPGEVVALHPGHNLALVSYDPAHIGQTEVRQAEFVSQELATGDEVRLVGMRQSGQLLEREGTVSDVDPLFLPTPNIPAFRPTNVDLVALQDAPHTMGGVLADKRGRVLAVWASFPNLSSRESTSWFRGIPSATVVQMVEDFRPEGSRSWRTLDVMWSTLRLSEARRRGLSVDAAATLEAQSPKRRQLLMAWSINVDGPAKGKIEEGDMLISVDGVPITRFQALEDASQVESVTLELFRDGEVITVSVPTRALGPDGTDRVVLWSGAVLQAPHDAVAQQHHQPSTGVYVVSTYRGSTARRYHLRISRRIVAVNGQQTPDLDAFLAAVAPLQDGAPVRLRLVDLDGRQRAMTLKLNLEFWPTEEILRTPEGWERRSVGASGTTSR